MSRLPAPVELAVIDTMDWVDPEAIQGKGAQDRIPLEADSLNAEAVQKAQQNEFAQLFKEADTLESDYEVHEGLLYSVRRPTTACPWYP